MRCKLKRRTRGTTKSVPWTRNWLTAIKITCAILLFFALNFSMTGPSEGAASFQIDCKEAPYVGVEVVLSLSGLQAESADIAYEWSFEGNVQPILFRRGGLECRFTPQDTNPFTASAAVVDSEGKPLASANVTMSAREFDVDIVMIEPAPFMLWDAATKKDTPADGLIAGEPVQFEIKLSPEYKKPLKYRWGVDASTAMRNGEEEATLTAVRNEIGDAELSAVVMNENGLILGRGSESVHVAIARSTVEESARRKKAWNQWNEALVQWRAGNFDEAMAGANAAVEADPATNEIVDGLAVMRGDYVRVERNRKLTADALALQEQKKPVDALRIFRRAYAAWALEDTKATIGKLESEIEEERVKVQRAEWLKDTASAYDQEGFFEEALKYYKETLTLQTDEAVAQRVERIERRLAIIAQAKTLQDEGRRLETDGQIAEALEKYKESLKLDPTQQLEAHTQELENTIRERKALAATLRREAIDLQRKNNGAEALLRFRESHTLWPDPDVEKRIAALEETVTESSVAATRQPEDFGIGTQADALRLLQEGHELYKKNQYRAALDVYRKSYSIYQDERLGEWIAKLETSLEGYESLLLANALIKEANALYNEARLPEALAKYKESLTIHSNPEVEDFVQYLENDLKNAAKSEISSADVAAAPR